MLQKKKRSRINRAAIIQIDHTFKIAEASSFVTTVLVPNDDDPDIMAYDNCEVLSTKDRPGTAAIAVEVRITDVNKPFKLLRTINVTGAHGRTEHEKMVHTYRLDGMAPKEV